MVIALNKMENYLLAKYPDQEEEIRTGIKILKGADFDPDSEEWVLGDDSGDSYHLWKKEQSA